MSHFCNSCARLASSLAFAVLVLASSAAPGQAADPAPRDEAAAEADRVLEKAILDAKVPPAAGDAAPAGPARPESLPAGETRLLGLTGESRAVRVTAHSAALRPAYGPAKPRDGRALLVLDLEFENVIPLTLVKEKKVATEYQVPNLADHLYLVVDGGRAARLRGDSDDLPGHIKVNQFKLRMIGTKARGNAVFEVPSGPKTVELRYYDYAHGHLSFRIAGPDAAFAAAAEAKPLSAPLKNEVVEAAAYSLEKVPEMRGARAPAGMTYVVAELRARSMFTVDGDATAFDPKARPGSKLKIGHVADWKESRKYLQLVADGEYAYMPEPALTELEEEPRFLPDVMTGGKVVFLAPEGSTSLELRCDFPNAKASTGGRVFRPKGLTLALEGKRPALQQRQPVVSVDDDVYRVGVVGQQTADEFAGEKPAGGARFLVLDVTVANRSSTGGEFFQTKEQLKYTAESGQQSELSPVTFNGPRRPSELVWVPPGERRTFQAVFEVPADEKRPRLAFRGVSKAEVLKLKEIAAAAPDAVATAQPPNPAKPGPQMPAKGQAAPAEKPPTEVAANTNVNPRPPARPAPQPSVPTKPLKPDAPAAKPTRVTAKQPHEPRGLAGVGLTPEQVNAAIDRGAEGLWALQKAEMKKNRTKFGQKLGYDVLVGLALVHAGYHKKSPEFDAQLRAMLAEVDPPDLGTYGAGCLIMLIESYGDGYFLPKLRQAGRCLLESQGPEGSWGYTARAPEEALRDPMADRVLQIRGGVPLEGSGALGTPMKRVTKFDPHSNGDNSTSQYALLGLWSATKAKVPVEQEAWKRALDVYRGRQGDDGGWNYTTRSYGYGSMTCAGVCAVALARHHLGEAAPAEDEAIERGLAWLANHFTVSKHPEGSDQHLFYYLYSLERVGRVLDTEFIGTHEWYPLGARWLLDNQKSDGTWGGGNHENPPEASSFALLFLTRATSTLNPEQKRGGDGTLRTDVAVAPGHRVYIILDCSGSMLPEMNGKQKFQIARDAVASLVEDLPDNAEVALRAYGHRKNARQEGADEDTELVVPMGKLDRRAFAAKLNALRARGKTPLALSLREAAKDLSGMAGDPKRPVTLVLLTDGGEDTRPRQDPLAAADAVGKLKALNFQLVGFDINRPDWTEQLAAMAQRGRGQYLPAAESGTLLRELRSAVFRVPDTFTVADAKGRPVMKSAFGTEKTLPEGKYSFATVFGGKRYTQEFWINTEATTAVVFDASKIDVDKSGRPAGAGRDAAQAEPAPTRREAPRAPSAPAAKNRFCTECGKPVATGAKFCPNCGAKVTGG